MRCGVLLFASLLIAVPLAAQDETHAVITLERTNCLETCPVYSVRIPAIGPNNEVAPRQRPGKNDGSARSRIVWSPGVAVSTCGIELTTIDAVATSP